jgi:hypothetical protein
VVRFALGQLIEQHERLEREERERAILARNRARLAKQAAALISEQAKP